MALPNTREPIAIIGMGCRFPGAPDVQAFWQLLCSGGNTVTRLPLHRLEGERDGLIPRLTTAERIEAEEFARVALRDPEQDPTLWGGYLPEVDCFDRDFFGISAREANAIDPQHRLLLEVAWDALEDAGELPARIEGSRAGVFIGQLANEYGELLSQDAATFTIYDYTGTSRAMASGRLSYALDLRGPSVTVDSACSSSLLAVHLACQSLWAGESTLAFAGGTNLILRATGSAAFTHALMLTRDGQCKAFDARADGFVRSEGVGIVVLKPLARALSDKNPIYATIRGSSSSNDGKSNGLLITPSQVGQEIALREAYRMAGIAPASVTYIEAHGPGTSVGDPVEAAALASVLGEGRDPSALCYLGSVKTNIGHTEAAAGVASLIKTALCLKHRLIPPSLHFQTPNPAIPWDEIPLRVVTQSMPWPASQPVIAGINSFGITGTNVHLALEAVEQHVSTSAEPQIERSQSFLLPLSAKTAAGLKALVQSWKALLCETTEQEATLSDLCYSASARRMHHEHRLAVVGRTQAEMAEQLEAFITDQSSSVSASQPSHADAKPPLVFVFPGQGSQWAGMGRQLFRQEKVFRAALQACEQAMRPYVDWSLTEVIEAGEDQLHLLGIAYVQPMLFALQVALARLWMSWGIEPSFVVGQSMGEVAAAHLAGILSLEDAARLICLRSQLLSRASGKGAMAVVGLSREAAQKVVQGYDSLVSLAVSNSPASTVLSGDPVALAGILADLVTHEVSCRLIQVDVASHSPQMDPLLDELRACLVDITPKEATLPFYSTVTMTLLKGPECGPEYWVNNLRDPVLFAPVIEQLIIDEHPLCLEISPHPLLLTAIGQCAGSLQTQVIALPSLRREENERTMLLQTLAVLYTQGHQIAWDRLFTGEERCVSLPGYPWQRIHCWSERSQQVSRGADERGWIRERAPGIPAHPFLQQYLQLATQERTHCWETSLETRTFPYLADHRVEESIVLPGVVYLEMGRAASLEAFGADPVSIEEMHFEKALLLPDDQPQRLQILVENRDAQSATLSFFILPPKGADPVLHAQGVIRHQGARLPLSSPYDLEELQHRCQEPISKAQHYQSVAQRGLLYGPSFQGLQQAWRGQGEILARVERGEQAKSEHTRYLTHPTFLDACLQIVLTAIPLTTAPTEMYLPISLKRFSLFEPLENEVWVYLRQQSMKDEASASHLVSDIWILNQAGHVCACIEGMVLQRIRQASYSDIDDWFYALEWEPIPCCATSLLVKRQPASWLIFADDRGVGARLAATLEASGDHPILVYPADAYQRRGPACYQMSARSAQDFGQLLQEIGREEREIKGLVHLWSLDTPPGGLLTETSLQVAQDRICTSTLHLVQALAQQMESEPPQLFLVTRGAQQVGGTHDLPLSSIQAALWGLGRVIQNEHPELCCKLIDLSPQEEMLDLAALAQELQAQDSQEGQVALRAAQRYGARLVPWKPEAEESEKHQFLVGPDHPFSLEQAAPGLLDQLFLKEYQRAAPQAGEIEVQVYATGLTFKDVLFALGVNVGQLHGAEALLGWDHAGQVSRVGPGVTDFQVGDAVILVKNGLRSYITLSADATVVRMPDGLSFKDAPAFPSCFATALYGLSNLAHLKAGERVLIHSAAGGVGQAAIQLAKLMGAEIFATAGTPEKRAVLRAQGIEHVMDSHSLAFADEVLAATGGRGVDVVLNSLSGEALKRSLSLLAPYGRFIEIGKRDIYQNSQIGLLALARNITFATVAMDDMAREHPALFRALLEELKQLYKEGRIEPLACTVYSINEAVRAFRFMAQGQHTGKIVFSMQEPEVLIEPMPEPLFKEQATYLITGGLGGLGLIVAEWMVEQGARHLVLLGRGKPGEKAQAVLDTLRARGACVLTWQANITQGEEVADVIHCLEQDMPPLRGILHAAAVLDDGTLLHLDQARLVSVMAPKVLGAWHLHQHTQHLPLDFFVCFSSAAGLLGSPGQGNYCAANTFLDAFVHERQAQGLPALSIDWGAWGQVGLAAAEAIRGERIAVRGLKSFAPSVGLQALEQLLKTQRPQLAFLPFDLEVWQQFYPQTRPSAFFDRLRKSRPLQSNGQETAQADVLLRIRSASQEERAALIECYLGERLAKILSSPDPIDPLLPLSRSGLDSLMTLELRTAIKKDLQVQLTLGDVLKSRHLHQLTWCIVEKFLSEKEEKVSEEKLEIGLALE